MKKGIIVFFRVAVILAVFGIGFSFGKSQTPAVPPQGLMNPEIGKANGVDFSLFWEAWAKLEDKFVDKEKIDYKNMLYGAISGMTNSMKDPYTIFLPPEDTKIFKEDVSGEFQGVGMEIGVRSDELVVIAPLEGTPAAKAGLMAGDKIIKINGTSTRGITADEAVKIIRGPKGTNVLLTIFREGWRDTRNFNITREAIHVPSLKWEIKSGDIAYVKIYQFSETASLAFREAAAEILNSKAQKVIVDLRNNPGGYLEVAQNIAGWFLERGQLVVVEDFGGKQENEEYRAGGPGGLVSYPLVVLINKGSASASEILAGALRDNRGIKLIGEQSFGKGSVQQLEELKEGSMKITVAKWRTPEGELIAEKGLTPDMEVKITEKDYDAGKDPQLDKAIEVLNGIR